MTIADETNDCDYHYDPDTDDCDLCREYVYCPTKDMCLAQFQTILGIAYECTRLAGHDGKHAACGIGSEGHPIVQWE